MKIMAKPHEVEALLDHCADCEDYGKTNHPDKTFEEGAAAGIRFLIGEDGNPIPNYSEK